MLYFLTQTSVETYSADTVGSEMDPWGAPQEKGAEDREPFSVTTDTDLWLF